MLDKRDCKTQNPVRNIAVKVQPAEMLQSLSHDHITLTFEHLKSICSFYNLHIS